MNIKLKTAILFMLISFFTTISQAKALDLEQAKAQGLVGETASGYLSAVTTNPSAEVQQLLSKINTERKSHYSQIANKNNTPVGAVEALAGKKAIELTQSGQFIQTKNGLWKKK